MSLDTAKRRFATFGVALAGILAGGALLGCSNSSDVAGNSAETGSPELAGVLYLDGGSPAALARVQCVPSRFDALHDTLPGYFQTMASDSGAYLLDSVPAGTYSLEAFDSKSGQMLLVQRIQVPDSGSTYQVVVSDTLRSPGYVLLNMDFQTLDGTKGVALVQGTTLQRPIRVDGNLILVDSLPADSFLLKLHLDDHEVMEFPVRVPVGDTAFMWLKRDGFSDVEPPPDTLIHRFIAPLAWPADVDTSLETYSSDIPIALRLDSSTCDFQDFEGVNGRWEAFRISADGARSKALPIFQSRFDTDAEQALFWVRVDSLNVTDSLELVFNTGLSSGYAHDVFPTSRAYTAVYHFDDGVDSVTDFAEKQGFHGTGVGLKSVAGVLGQGAQFDGLAYVTVDGSAASDSTRKTNLNYGYRQNVNFSLWVKLDDTKSSQTILAKGESQYALRFSPDTGFVAEVFHEAEPAKDSASDTTSYKMVVVSDSGVVKAGRWMFISFNGYGSFTMFIDGVQQKTKYAKVPWKGTRSENKDFEIGRMDGTKGAVNYFKGSMDEIAVVASLRKPAWIMATYLNQRPDQVWPKLVAE